MLKGVTRVGGLAALVLSLASAAFAQAGRSGLSGTVFDQGKAVLPGAAVVATNEATGITRDTVAGPEGRYTILTLTPGTYTVRVQLQGFQVQTRTGLIVGVGQEVTADFTLPLSGVAENLTVTGESPVVEVTTSRVGTNITRDEIDNLPTSGRSQLSLMQLVPGLTPSLDPGTFEGGQFNANGRDTGSNLFMIDGGYNNDERNGGAQGTQTRISLDSMAEFQVLTHQYTAEFGGSSGVIVNAITRSGSNRFSGRGFYYYQDESLRATDPFLKLRGEKNPESGEKIYGFNVGGPIIRNKLFWFFNLERDVIKEAVQLNFPREAAPLSADYSDARSIKALNSFVRGDYTAGRGHNFSFRWVRERAPTIGEAWEDEHQTRDHVFVEGDTDHISNGNWTAVIGNRATNEVRVTHVREDVLQGQLSYFDDNLKFIELNGRDQFDVGSSNLHPDIWAGPNDRHGAARGRSTSIDEAFTFVKSGWGGDHTFKTGVNHIWSLNRPQIFGRYENGAFDFSHNRPFNPADPFTYPSQFRIRLGQIYFNLTDNRTNAYVQDKWHVNKNVTLNLGVRYDYQSLTPNTKDAVAPRLGIAYNPTGSGKTVIRGGAGKFYEYQLAAVQSDLVRLGPISPSYLFDTGEDLSADRGVAPTNDRGSGCLRPSGNNGLAVISPECRAFLTNLRNQVNAAGFPNDEPYLDGDRRMGYLWSFSVGVERELFPNVAMSVDYVGNRGRDQTGLIDINEGPPGPDGRATRLGVNGFDPTGTLIPAAARSTTFRRVLQYQTRDDLNTDYNGLELSLEKRYSSRWSGRFAYTLSRARDVFGVSRGAPAALAGGAVTAGKRFSNDLNPREDYGLSNFDNRHALSFGVNANPWRGLGAGAVFRYYSGYPINETVGSDLNGDRDGANFDRPVSGIHDRTRPIVSALDSNGRAIRNGIDGEKQIILDLRFQYIVNLPNTQTAGFFWEIYNATNRVNYGTPTGNRRSSNFLIPILAGDPARMQLGVRYTF